MQKALSVLGEILITLAVLIGLYLVHSAWVSNFAADVKATAQLEVLRDSWGGVAPDSQPSDSQPATATVNPPSLLTEPDIGQPFALAYIPRLAQDVWAEPIVQGTRFSDLASGMGHYPGTAMPGGEGNFAIAGHRAGNGEPLMNIQNLVLGDRVIIETATGFYVYELTRDAMVTPQDVWVIAPPPAGESVITITTCHPRWNATERWIWWGELVETRPKSEPPADLGGY